MDESNKKGDGSYEKWLQTFSQERILERGESHVQCNVTFMISWMREKLSFSEKEKTK